MSGKVQDAVFVGGFASVESTPKDPQMIEIAVVGRSNVGKSTLINRLTGRKGLARTSSTPGRTQELNFFKLQVPLGKSSKPTTLLLVDLPGFGFAKLSHAKRDEIGALIQSYLTGREQLKILLLLNDSRRLPEAEELMVRDLAFNAGAHVLVVLTKFDKLSGNERKKQIKSIAEGYGLEETDLVCSGEGLSADEIWKRVSPLLT